jgi:hypothetical protein
VVASRPKTNFTLEQRQRRCTPSIRDPSAIAQRTGASVDINEELRNL